MNAAAADTPVAGVDGCKGGWVAVARLPGHMPAASVNPSFEDLLASLPGETIIAVDMPIGLPERTGQGGRGPEQLVRRHLGPRQSSVFSIPSRAAVYAETAAFTDLDQWYAAHRRASAVARATSEPPRAISIQAFAIFPKIREVDLALRRRPDLAGRVIESHPEAALWRLNGERAMALPKKIKGAVNRPGIEERQRLLVGLGVDPGLFAAVPPGAAADDLTDAAALLFVAERHATGLSIPFPDPSLKDASGLPIAIWT